MLAPYLEQFRTSDDFESKTGIRRVKLRKFRDGKLNNPEVRTVVAICAGLDLDITETMEMLRSAGHILLNTREHTLLEFHSRHTAVHFLRYNHPHTDMH